MKKRSKWSQNKSHHFKDVTKYGQDILDSENFRKSRHNIQHGSISVMEHSISVAIMSLYIAEKYHIKCNKKDLIRGALLHDYFLYDWHHTGEGHRLHGFFHPAKAYKNAKKEYTVSDIQKDIILKHMWPLTVVPPKCREAWIVTLADKYVSTIETINIRK